MSPAVAEMLPPGLTLEDLELWMSNDLAELVEGAGGSVLAELPDADLEMFDGMGGGEILPFLALQGSNSDLVKEDKVAKGTFTLTHRKGEFYQLGKSVEALIVDVRRKALDLQDKKKPKWSFDINSPLFQQITEQAKSKIDDIKKSRLFGLEFLIFIPDVENEEHRYATLFMGNASGRYEAPKFKPLMRKPVLLKSDIARNDKGHIWEVIRVFASQRKIELPDFDKAQLVRDAFKNPSEMPKQAPVEAPTAPIDRG